MSPTELKKKLDEREKGNDDFILVDVRNPNEQEIAVIPGTDMLIPLPDFDVEISKLEKYKSEGKEIIVYCRSGGRSTTAYGKLKRNGFTNVSNLEGGILSYSDQADPSIPKY
ncbi:MAG TPA: rhodanese-like domain-containing protein [Leptospiraceae bacterium]|nr:rhodanese-like domain-containing protein [Leptospiraceae bacterium]HMX31484.1 rhodanese-like domain-containing protein [Leptospiraceae bacterium]HMY33594.1 rhodanese-like domain-containing protein [Leptospiraceae bacterium]HMZ62593.1 rhodanese-like domain-containing protein [Leptospiraceae bacterium]HNA07966.1 rhodanese-like domain-containing protein [Leptospiraceae bacterium]